jgi:hypothetical protein
MKEGDKVIYRDQKYKISSRDNYYDVFANDLVDMCWIYNVYERQLVRTELLKPVTE